MSQPRAENVLEIKLYDLKLTTSTSFFTICIDLTHHFDCLSTEQNFVRKEKISTLINYERCMFVK